MLFLVMDFVAEGARGRAGVGEGVGPGDGAAPEEVSAVEDNIEV